MKKCFTLMALMAMFVMNAVFAQEEKPILTFGCLSDLHSQQTLISGDVESVRLRGTITTTLNAMKAEENLDLIVLGGDYLSDVTISYENYLRTRELLVEATRNVFPEGAKTPVIYMNGNHEYEVANFDDVPKGYNAGDYYDIPMKTDIGALADEDCFYEMASNGSSEPVKLLAAYHYVIKGFDFVVLNTGKNFFQYAWNYTYSDESIEWVGNKLEEIYAENPNKTVFFLVHLPFGDSNSISSASKGMTDNCAALLKPILAKYPNLIMLYGHDHGKDTAYIREKTEQRVTVYDSYGNKWVDPNAVEAPTAYYVRNASSGMYLNFDAATNLTTTAEKAVAEVLPSSLVENTYSISYPDGNNRRYTQSGSSGRFSGNVALSANSSLYVYKVEDSSVQQGTATRVESIKGGEAYLFVALSSKGGYWMLTNEPYGESTSLRLVGVKVSDEVPGDEISFTQSADYSPVWILEEAVAGEQEDLPVYYIQNYNTSKYLGHNSVNLANTDKQTSDVTITPSTVTEGALNFYLTGFVEAYSGPYLYCGSNGRFSGNKQKDNASSQILAFEVEDPAAATITAKQVTEITAGKTYLLVGLKNGGYYALTNEMYMEGDASNQRMVGAAVTITDGTITFTPSSTSSVLWTIGEKEIVPVEPGTKSFFSAFMGSMRYYSNSIETGGSTVNDSRIIQAMIVYVYPDRVELKMKNYGESGTINGITVNKDLEPYVSYRTVEHSAEAVTPAPAFDAETLKEEVALGETVEVGVVAPAWYNVYFTFDGTEPTEASESVKGGGFELEWTPEAEGEYTIKIAAQEGVRLLSESVAYTFIVKDPTDVSAVESAGAKAYASAAGIAVRNYTGIVKVHNVLGQQATEVAVDGCKDIAVDKGIYIVVLGAKAFKVIVK